VWWTAPFCVTGRDRDGRGTNRIRTAVILPRAAIGVAFDEWRILPPTAVDSPRICKFHRRAEIHMAPEFFADRRARFGDFPELSETNRLQLQCFRQTLRALSGKCAVDSIGKGSVR
jgi:hypothetical protein